MTQELDALLAELGQLTRTAHRLLMDVIDQQTEMKAFQAVLLKRRLVTPEELIQAREDAGRQIQEARGEKPGHCRRPARAVREPTTA